MHTSRQKKSIDCQRVLTTIRVATALLFQFQAPMV